MTHRSSIQSIRQFTQLFCRKSVRIGGAAGALVLLFLLFTGGTAQAQSCTTTVTTAADSGAGSLRAALGSTAANGTICFDAATFSTPQTITLASGLSITRSLTISGTGIDHLVLSGNNAYRVISVTTGVDVTLKNLTVRNGMVANNTGAGIHSRGALTLTNVNVFSNTAGTNTAALGGGLYVSGTLTMNGGRVEGNRAARGGGVYVNAGAAALTGVGVYSNTAVNANGGGGLYSMGVLTMTDSAVFSNTCTPAGCFGGGVAIYGGTALLSGGRIVTNTATGSGGGLYLATGAMTVTITGLELYSNTSGSMGGGVYMVGGALTILTSTVGNNSSSNGGGLAAMTNGSLVMTNTAVYGNRATSIGGGIYNDGRPVTLYASQVYSNASAGNTGGGGIYCTGATGVLRVYAGSTITGNQAVGNGNGGGINIGSSGRLEVVDSSVGENSASSGGGIYAGGASAVTLERATIYANTAITDNAGGLYVSGGALTVTASTVATNTAKKSGGGMWFGGATLRATLNGSSIYSNTASDSGVNLGGGGAYVSSGVFTFTNMTIANNLTNGSNSYGGGILMASNPVVRLDGDNRVYNNRASSGGGGIHMASGALTMTGGAVYSNTITANVSSYGGGGLRVENGAMLLTSTQIYSNSSATSGGGLHIVAGAVTLAGSAVTTNTAAGSSTHGGGGIRINSGAITLTATSLAGNAVPNSNAVGGGGLYVVAGTVAVSAGEVTSNTAPMGGGIYLAAGTLTVDGTPVQRNRASSVFAGGLYAHTGTQTTLTNTAFFSNSAAFSGGGIAGYGVLTATGITLAGNSAGSDGGGGYLSGVSTLRGAQVYSNTAAGVGQGGGLRLSGATLLLTDAAIYSNTAYGGGGLSLLNSTATAMTVTVTGNRADSGGGIKLSGSGGVSGLRLTGATIAGNVAGAGSSAGGGIAVSTNSWLTITQSSIYSNSAGAYGGGISHESLTSWVDVDASSIYSNTSGAGGGIYSAGPITLTNSTVAHNQASTGNGGGIYHYSTLLRLRNVTLAGNTAATQGGGLFLDAAATANLTNTLVVNSTTGGAPGGDIQGTGALNQAQVLTGARALGALQNNGGATWTMALPASSPAIDAGVDCPATDQRGVARPQGSACDIGAYEARPSFVLSVTVAGTGSGTIASTPGGIDCGATCAASFELDTAVTLAATPVNALFDGWSGACSGSGACTVTMTATKSVTATFTACPVGVAYVNRNVTGGANSGVSWPNAYADLQDALHLYDTCNSFNEIWVARGLYTPGITYSDTFTIPAGVALYGGFAATETVRTQRDWAANVTVLSGDLGGDDGMDGNGIVTDTATITGINAYQVALMLSITSTAPITGETRLDGFTITAGNATGPGYNRYGGGLFCHAYAAGSQCSPTLANVTFSGNQGSVGAGMAIFAEGGVSSPHLTDVLFRHNKAVVKSMGGGFAVLGMFTAASPVLTDVTFYSNTAAIGGAMLVVAVSNSVSSPVLNNVIFDGNAGAVGGAMANVGYSTGVAQATLADVLFSDNRGFIDSAFRAALDRNQYGANVTAAFGGALANVGYWGGTAGLTMTGATLQGNRTDAGGAFVNAGAAGSADATVQHTRVLGNHARLEGGGVYNIGFGGAVSVALSNVLLRDNTAAGNGGALVTGANLVDSVAVTVTNATFYSNTAGVGGAILLMGAGSAAEQPTSLHLANSILWGNRGITGSAQISLTNQATMTIGSSLVEGGWNGAGVNVTGASLVDGGGNVAADPLLTESGSDLTLLPGSPALDAGNNSFVDTLVDLVGKSRIFNAVVDMGAYEAQGFALAIAGGDAQSTPISNTFAAPLQITVTDSGGQPIGAGGVLTFTPPASGAGLSSAAPFTVTTNASGAATATVAANSVAGSYPVTVTARGVVTPVVFTLTNLGLTVSVIVASAVNPSVYGQAVTFTATVTNPLAAAPSGAVRFSVDSQVAATRTLDASGVATWTTGSLTVGDHAVVASYGGDSSFDPGASVPITQTVNPAATSVALTSTPNPSVFGQAVIFTATVTVTAPGVGTPTGVVTFTDGSDILGSGALNASGVATFATSSLIAALPGNQPAQHSISAEYGGDANFTGATSNTVDQVVDKASTAAVLASGVHPAVFGQAILFTATVTVQAPSLATVTGEDVTFKDGASTLGAGVLDVGGVATFTTSLLATGAHSITAVYGGTPNMSGSTAPTLTQTVDKAGVTVSVVSTPNPSVHGQGVTITATVTISAPGAGAPTGVITFTANGGAITGCAPVALANYQAVCVTSALATGDSTITAAYGGDANFGASTGILAGGQVVGQAETVAVVTSAPNPSGFKQAATFTATVTAVAPGAGIPTGVVTFTAAATQMGAVALDATGTATLTTANLVVGSHAISAQYGGDGDFLPASTDVHTHTVIPAGTATALALAPNPARYGESVRFTATVTVSAAALASLAPTPSGPTGGVRFTDPTGTVDLTGTVNSGVAVVTGGVIPAGSYTVTATYLGDSSYSGSTSAPAVLVVQTYATAVSLASSINPVFVGDVLSFSAEVHDLVGDAGYHDAGGFAGPTGSVTIADSTGVISLTGALVNGSVTLDAPWLAAGTYTLTATYHGDVKYAGAISAIYVQGVNRHGTGTMLDVAPTTAFVSDTIRVTATVTISDPAVALNGGITGTVAFLVNGVQVDDAELVNGQVHVGAPATAAGVFTITASYRGNETYAASDAAASRLTVVKRGSVAAITAAPNPSGLGQAVVFTAVVAEVFPDALATAVTPPLAPSGEVVFAEQGVELGRGTLVRGTAFFTTSLLAVGEHAVVAAYLGDGAFLPGNSPVYTQTVQPRPLAVNDAAGTLQGEAVSINTLANDLDPAGGGLAVTGVTQPVHGSTVINGGATSVTYTPAPDFFGLDAFAYTIQDANGVTATASVAVVISAKADSGAPQVAPIDDTQPTTVTFNSGADAVIVIVPPGAYNGAAGPLGPTDIFFVAFTEIVTPTDHVLTPPGGLRFGGKLFTLEVFFNQTRLEHYQFPQPLTLTIGYTPGPAISEVNPDTLLLYTWDTNAAPPQWSQAGLTFVAHDALNHTLTYLVAHFTEFALFGSAAPTALDPGEEPLVNNVIYLPVVSQ